MARFMASRLKKLEDKRSKPKTRRTLDEFDPATGVGTSIGLLAAHIMRVSSWPSNEAWEQALTKQQARLTARTQ
jgi:hypothetical protein